MPDFRREREEKSKEYDERVVAVDRISYTVAGGRRMRFRALVVIGNRRGKVGIGVAKAGEVQTAIQKAARSARRRLVEVPIIRGTIPYPIEVSYGGARVFLKPAGPGTSVIAGGSIRAVLELAGVTDILSKSLGSSNKVNSVKATLLALQELKKIAPRRTQMAQGDASQTEPEVAPSEVPKETAVKPPRKKVTRAPKVISTKGKKKSVAKPRAKQAPKKAAQ